MGVRLLILLLGVVSFGMRAEGQTIHRVKEGESLWLIAKRVGVSVDAIREANQLKNDVIWEGADLKIPAPTPKPTISESVPITRPASPEQPKVREKEIISVSSRSKGPLSEAGMQVLQLQVMLDRAGFSPGVLDGYDGKYTRLAKTLCEAWNPTALQRKIPATTRMEVTANWRAYVDVSLPGSGKSPDFKALTKNKRVMKYYSASEYFAERYHCSEGLLKKLNPKVDFSNVSVGDVLQVPNVIPFEIERYFDRKGEGIWGSGLGKASGKRMVYISADDMTLTIWEGSQLVRAYPITLNLKDSPRGQRELGPITPGPHYSRKKTGLELLPGPNSPVGIVWCPLGDGFGIHGTSNPDSIGRATSSGCVRLANWDAVRFAEKVRKGTHVKISERKRSVGG